MNYIFHKNLFLYICFLLLLACGSKKAETSREQPSKQSNPLTEKELNQITLTDKAVQRLGIQTVEVVATTVNNFRMFSGEIMAVPGKTITVTAPVPGTLLPGGKTIAPGLNIRKGESLYKLLIMPSEKDMISAQEEVGQREVQYNTAVEKVKRTSRMYEEKSGSLRAKQEAEAELAGITAQLRVARGRIELLRGNPSAATSRLSTLNMEAPISGTVLNVHTSPSQVLSAGAPIVDIVSLHPLWVRVALYAGDESRIAKGKNATVQGLSGGSGRSLIARSVTGPQTSNPQATSIDLYYEIDNNKGDLRPGQKVSVTLPFTGTTSGIVVPYSAIVYDIHGGTWVYTNPQPNVFVRQRVEIQTVIGQDAVLHRGPSSGTKVVSTGAAELFGTEFGGGK